MHDSYEQLRVNVVQMRRERDTALSERDDARAEKNEARETRALDNRDAEKMIEDLTTERDDALAARNHAKKDCIDWAERCENVTKERDIARAEREESNPMDTLRLLEKVTLERGKLLTERDAAKALLKSAGVTVRTQLEQLKVAEQKAQQDEQKQNAMREQRDLAIEECSKATNVRDYARNRLASVEANHKGDKQTAESLAIHLGGLLDRLTGPYDDGIQAEPGYKQAESFLEQYRKANPGSPLVSNAGEGWSELLPDPAEPVTEPGTVRGVVCEQVHTLTSRVIDAIERRTKCQGVDPEQVSIRGYFVQGNLQWMVSTMGWSATAPASLEQAFDNLIQLILEDRK